MLRPWRLTFSILCIFITACSKPQALQDAYEITPGTLLHSQFNEQGTLVISTLEQVAVYSKEASLQALLQMPHASGSWQVQWLTPELIAITDANELYLWFYSDDQFSGPWSSGAVQITTLAATKSHLIIAYENGQLERLTYDNQLNLQSRQPLRTVTADDESPSRIQALLSHADGFAVIYNRGHIAYYSDTDSSDTDSSDTDSSDTGTEPDWQKQFTQPHRIRTGKIENNKLRLVLQKEADRFARGGEQQIVQMDKNNGKIIQVDTVYLSGQGASLLAFDDASLNAHIIGSSENCLHLVMPSELTHSFCYPKPERFGRNSGQVIALYQDPESLYAVTTSGFLQVWRKQDIVNLLTDR